MNLKKKYYQLRFDLKFFRLNHLSQQYYYKLHY